MMAILLFVALAHGAGSTEPVLQVTDYNVIPDNIYPGTTGQLEIHLLNSGSETAKGTVVYYNYGIDQQWNIYVGDIGAGSEAITTIPFVVPEKINSGIFILTLDVYYLDEEETSSKHSAASIPITVSQHGVLEVKTVSLSSDSIGKGERLTAELEIKNTGGVMKNVVISNAENSSFSLEGTTQQRVGDIEANSSTNVTVEIISSSTAAEGKYTIPLILTYNDALQNEISQTIYLGPVMVSDSSSQLRISCKPVSGSEIGSQLSYNFTVQNRGSSTQSAVIVMSGTDVFTPIGSNTFYLDDIKSGESRSQLITLGVDAASTSGYYILPITMKTSGDEQEYEIGIVVQATPAITLTSETETADDGTQVTIKIANSGNTAIRSVYVKADSTESLEVEGTNEKFIGTLSVDDYASFQFTVNQKRPDSSGSIPITIVFKDNDNVEHTVKENVVAGSGSAVALAATNATSQSSQLGGPRSGGLQFQNLLLYGGVGVLILGGLYFGYRKFRGKPKKSEAMNETHR